MLIIPRTLRLLREAVDVLLESTPKGLDLDRVRGRILRLGHVHGVPDMHASLVATGLPVLTAHVVVDESCFHDGHLGPMLDELQECIASDFDVTHSTIQFESAAHAGTRDPRLSARGAGQRGNDLCLSRVLHDRTCRRDGMKPRT